MQTKTISIFSVLIILSFSILIIREATVPIGKARTGALNPNDKIPIKEAVLLSANAGQIAFQN